MVSKRWLKKLSEEARQWVNEGIIGEEQEARLRERYSRQPEYSRLINTIIALGAILVGLGVILFVASNWEHILKPAKVAIIFSVILGFNFSAYYFRFIKDKFPGLAEGLILIGAFSFGAGIWLIAQIYQIHYNFSAGILFWIIGLLPVVFVFRSWTTLALSSVLSVIWLFSYHTYYFDRDAYGFFLLLAALVLLCYRQQQRFSLFVAIGAAAVWLGHFWMKYISLYEFAGAFEPHLILTILYATFGFMLYALGILHENKRSFIFSVFLYKMLAVLFITLSAYSFTFSHHYNKDVTGSAKVIPSLIVAIGVMLLVAFAIFSYLRHIISNAHDSKETSFVFYLYCLQIMAFLISMYVPSVASLNYNLLLLVEIFVFMYIGFIKHSEGIFRLSIAVFFIEVLSRYFDIFWKMMPRSLLFIIGGALLIIGTVFANNKRIDIEGRMRSSK